MGKSDLAVWASNVCKTYKIGDLTVEALKNVSLKVAKGKFVAVCGPSGSGKTTLLNVISGIDSLTSGKVLVLNQDLSGQNEDFLANFRCNNIGFVFQSYNLVSTLTVAENIAFPMEWLRKPIDLIENRVKELLELVGLQSRAEHLPSQLSGGEQQRVAFARALANDPALLLADEPTGNLDTKTGLKIVDILKEMAGRGKTIIVATHDEKILSLAHQKVVLEDGVVLKNIE